jgi:hypothetical protein
MELRLKPTSVIEMINGTQCRRWEGMTATGTPVRAYVAVVECRSHDPERNAEFERELQERFVESRQPVVFDTRFIV